MQQTRRGNTHPKNLDVLAVGARQNVLLDHDAPRPVGIGLQGEDGSAVFLLRAHESSTISGRFGGALLFLFFLRRITLRFPRSGRQLELLDGFDPLLCLDASQQFASHVHIGQDQAKIRVVVCEFHLSGDEMQQA